MVAKLYFSVMWTLDLVEDLEHMKCSHHYGNTEKFLFLYVKLDGRSFIYSKRGKPME